MNRGSINSPLQKTNLQFWIKRISKCMSGNHLISDTNLILDYERPVQYSNKIEHIELEMDGVLLKKIIEISKSDKFLIYCIMMGALNVCLYKYNNGVSPIIIGSPLLKEENESTISTNSLSIISKVKDNCSFKDLLLEVKANLVESYKKQDYIYNELIRELKLVRAGNKCATFNILLASENIHHNIPAMKQDISISINCESDHIIGTIAYNESLFRGKTIELFSNYYLNVLKQVVEKPDIMISDVTLTAERETIKHLLAINDTERNYPSDKYIHQLFEDMVAKYPQATALECGMQKLTYSELNRKANQLAHYLRKLGLKPGSNIGLYIECSVEMVIGMLAALKAGYTYIQIDPLTPANSKEMINIIGEIGCIELFMTKVSVMGNISGEEYKITCLDYDWEKIAKEHEDNPTTCINDTAYIVFSISGRETPSGHKVRHVEIINYLSWNTEKYVIGNRDKCLLIGSFESSFVQQAMWIPLTNGGELHLLHSGYLDPNIFITAVEKMKITQLYCTPQQFYLYVEDKTPDNLSKLETLRHVFLRGESINASRLREWFEYDGKKAKVVNIYDVKENGGCALSYELSKYDEYMKSSVPIGKPIFNTKIYILDHLQKLVPKGILGEICITGVNVKSDQLGDAKYIRNPYDGIGYETLFRTGDLGRYFTDDNVEYFGHIEPEMSIELLIKYKSMVTIMKQNKMIKDAIIVRSRDNNQVLAYMVKMQNSNGISNEEIIKEVKSNMKDAFDVSVLPNSFYVVDNLPIRQNGKIDRYVMMDPSRMIGSPISNESKAQMDQISSLVLRLFAETLKLKQVKLDDNFFEIGGHSLLAASIIAELSEKLETDILIYDFLANPTGKMFTQRIMQIIRENSNSFI